MAKNEVRPQQVIDDGVEQTPNTRWGYITKKLRAKDPTTDIKSAIELVSERNHNKLLEKKILWSIWYNLHNDMSPREPGDKDTSRSKGTIAKISTWLINLFRHEDVYKVYMPMSSSTVYAIPEKGVKLAYTWNNKLKKKFSGDVEWGDSATPQDDDDEDETEFLKVTLAEGKEGLPMITEYIKWESFEEGHTD